jgi:aryl-alcohol dehydrogenase-like predicted oxidoreductase
MDLRPLGNSGLQVSSVALGCWPIAGMTSPDVSDADSLATIEACFDLGINFLDTAYAYGPTGESERLIARALGNRRQEMVIATMGGRRQQMVIATKGGIEWGPGRQQIVDGRPATLRRQCDESLQRLGTDRVELYYLHAPDPKVPIAESAGAIKELIEAGKTVAAGVSNVNLEQLQQFAAACPLSAYQPAYNMLQREIEASTLPWCQAHDVAACVYWPLMKGLLAGRLERGHQFAEGDSRRKYPMFQGDEWEQNQQFVDRLRRVADEAGRTVAQLVINWTIHRSGITVALCGAKRPAQIQDTAGAMGWRLSAEQLAEIEAAIAARGKIVARAPV